MTGMPTPKARLARIMDRRRAITVRAATVSAAPPSALARLSEVAAVETPGRIADAQFPREWRAIYNLDEVARMSAAGMPVAEIAAALDLSYRHVVKIRARLGLGRRR